MNTHHKKTHKFVACDKCELSTTRVGHPNDHKQSKHEDYPRLLGMNGLIFHCEICDFTHNKKIHLKAHKQTAHKLTAVNITWIECNFKTKNHIT